MTPGAPVENIIQYEALRARKRVSLRSHSMVGPARRFGTFRIGCFFQRSNRCCPAHS